MDQLNAEALPLQPTQEKPKEKTIFTVKLDKIDPASKAKIIKEVKAIMPNMNLVEVRQLLHSESCPYADLSLF